MTNKVTVTIEVSEAIEYAKSVHGTYMNILDDVINCGGSGDALMEVLAERFGGDEKELMRALVNGYEVDMTPEDKIRRYYNEAMMLSKEAVYPDGGNIAIGRITAIRQTLSYLGIKYEGINA